MPTRFFKIILLLAIAVLHFPVGASEIEEVVVSARKFKEPLLESPLAITAFSPSHIKALGIEETRDLEQYTPGLVVRKQNGSQDNYAFSIRGVNTSETALTSDPTVGVYLDGVYLARTTGGVFDLVDLAAIEVLKGPQGALFGRNTIGGAINLVSAEPAGQSGLLLESGVGNRGKSHFKSVLDTPQIGPIRSRLSYFLSHSERDYTSAFTGQDLGNADSEGYRANIQMDVTHNLLLSYSFDRIERKNNSNIHQLTLVRDSYADPSSPYYGGTFYKQAKQSSSDERLSVLPAFNARDDETTSVTTGNNLTAEWNINERVVLKSISAVREWDSFAAGTEFGTFEVQSLGDMVDMRNGEVGLVEPGEKISLFSATRKNTHIQLSQEFQVNWQLSDNARVIIGLYGMDEEGDEDNPQQFVLPARVLPLLMAGVTVPAAPATGSAVVMNAPFYYEYENQSKAVYTHLDIDLTDTIALSLGGRYTHDKKSVLLSNTLDGESDAKTLQGNKSWSDFSPSFTVRYLTSMGQAFYMRYAQGYRSGGYNARAQTSSAFLSPYDQEYLESYELGMKGRWMDERLQIEAALFLNDYTNQQVPQFEAGSGGASSATVNAGSSTAIGLELSMIYVTPIEGFTVSGNYACLDFEYKEYVAGPLDPETGFPNGENQDISDRVSDDVYAPDHSGAISFDYTKNLAWGEFNSRLDVSYTDSITFGTVLYENDRADAYALINGRISLSEISVMGATLEIGAWGKNLGNKEYRQQGLDFGLMGIVSNSYGELRSYGVDVGIKW